ncbi:VWA domain-containing protein [Cellvibrio sp. PSBB023]|jgi:Ca-activated chloride channel family protein|uniref:vWA domain-containing protein n=1 Tax=Cellvibrio sp. PSBB023 TaxID=1945512 RepID=UPI000990231C|nr:VWA domain-containing protein [Cellvibrio sp. PSBB023]AQT59803.1 BatB protein [Cellvibrio sp. PSBB023]
MFEMQWPWLLLLAPLPLAMVFIPAKKRVEAALRVPFYQHASQLDQHSKLGINKRPAKLIALWLMWLACVFAATNPQWVGEPTSMPSSGRDLLMAVDISGSMEQTDMAIAGRRVTRLMAVKKVIGDFVVRRNSDRMGLILFGAQAYLQAPLTYDRKTVNQLLQEAQIGFAGRETAIGDAIGLAVKRLRDRPAASRVLVLLTDGANTSGQLSPDKATELAQQANIKIYTIAFGADSMEVPGIFGSRTVNPSRDLDEPTMMNIAEKTGGKYFRARNLEELDNIHRELDRLEPIEMETETFRPVQTLFYWPLAIAFLISLLLASLHIWQGRAARVEQAS